MTPTRTWVLRIKGAESGTFALPGYLAMSVVASFKIHPHGRSSTGCVFTRHETTTDQLRGQQALPRAVVVRHFRPLPIAQGRIDDDSSRGPPLFLVVSIEMTRLGRPRKAKVAGSNPVFRLRFGPADLAGLRVPGQELVRPCARSC